MITITHEQLIAGGIAFGGLVAWVIVAALWMAARAHSKAARIDKEESDRNLKRAKEERNKAELVLEETKRYLEDLKKRGFRLKGRPARGKWGRLGYSEGPVGPDGGLAYLGPQGVTGWSGPSIVSGPTGAQGRGRTESEVIRDMLEYARVTGTGMMEDRMLALFKEVMTMRDDE